MSASVGRSSARGTPSGALEELVDHFDAVTLGRAHERHRRSELLGEGGRVEGAAPRLELVGHVQDDERREAEGEDRSREDEVALEVRRVEDQEDRVRLLLAGHRPGQDVAGHALVLRARREAVDARQVDEDDLPVAVEARAAAPLLDRHAGIVRDLLAEAREAVEERRLAGVRRPDEADEPGGAPERQRRHRAAVAVVQGAHRLSPVARATDAASRCMCLAVSPRRANSVPSTR